MSLVFDPIFGQPIHYPKRRDIFEFDEEVTSIFENMAYRSIPMYSEVHRVHSAIAADYINNKGKSSYSILDVGSSTGMFFKALINELGIDPEEGSDIINGHAVDISPDMLDSIDDKLPWVYTHNIDIKEFLDDIDNWSDLSTFDIVNMSYVLQFISPIDHEEILQSIAEFMVNGGLLFLAQKDIVNSAFQDVMFREYFRFRKDNGYTEEEIKRKNEALKNVMYPIPLVHQDTLLRKVGFGNITETTRWLNFSSTVCTKGIYYGDGE